MKYSKPPPLAIPDQITLLKQRGMAFADEAAAALALPHINYYRLRAYWLPFEDGPNEHEPHTFRTRHRV